MFSGFFCLSLFIIVYAIWYFFGTFLVLFWYFFGTFWIDMKIHYECAKNYRKHKKRCPQFWGYVYWKRYARLLFENLWVGEPTVSARELHEALGVASRFSRWFDSNKDLFIEGEDYNKCTSSTVVNNGAIRELEDYSMSVLMAKHICLMSRTEKGKRCRDYLIDLEKAWNTPEQIFARALKMADKTIESLKKDNAVLME